MHMQEYLDHLSNHDFHEVCLLNKIDVNENTQALLLCILRHNAYAVENDVYHHILDSYLMNHFSLKLESIHQLYDYFNVSSNV